MENFRMPARPPGTTEERFPTGFLSRAQLAEWLDELAEIRQLVAPRFKEGLLLYGPVESAAGLVWEFTRPVLPVKEFFFPPTERLLTIEKNGRQVRLVETLPEERLAIFGVRSCEARGVRTLDALFLDSRAKDPYYARRRGNTVLIGLACRQMGDTCFCTSTGSAPDDPSDVDIMLTEVDEGYYLQVMTEKGLDLLGDHMAEVLARTRPFEYPKPAEVASQTFPVPPTEAWPAQFEDAYWEELGERCLSCRVCAYICPTCRCFDLRDEALAGEDGGTKFERIRCWDSCTGPAYRRIAGGHNPRATQGQRLRNRFYCKFYYYPNQYGLASSACTGCGRCIDECPVNIDITEVLSHLSSLLPA